MPPQVGSPAGSSEQLTDAYTMRSSHQFHQWVAAKLDACANGEKLPVDTELSRMSGLSLRTVRRVMRSLREKGTVVRVPGKGTFKAPLDTDSPLEPHPPPPSSAERLERYLTTAIHRGELKRGEKLPQIKYLRLQFHVSDKTVSSVYRTLERRHLIHRIGRSWFAGTLQLSVDREALGEVYVVADNDEGLHRIYRDTRMAAAYVRFEREMRAYGAVVRYITLNELPQRIQSWQQQDRFPIGVVLYAFNGEQYMELRTLLAPLTKGPIPPTTLLLDLVVPAPLKKVPPEILALARGAITNEQARAAAAYIEKRTDINQVCLVYDGYDLDGKSPLWIVRFLKFSTAVQTRTGQPVPLVFVSGNGTLDMERIHADILRSHTGYFRYLDEQFGKSLGRTEESIREHFEVCENYTALAETFGRRTLWLCTTDHAAVSALEEIANTPLSVPDDIELLTLESSVEHLAHGLSACAPDWDRIGYLMAHGIIRDFPIEKTHRRFIKLSCDTSLRLTTKW